jgi:hypothetical protein
MGPLPSQIHGAQVARMHLVTRPSSWSRHCFTSCSKLVELVAFVLLGLAHRMRQSCNCVTHLYARRSPATYSAKDELFIQQLFRAKRSLLGLFPDDALLSAVQLQIAPFINTV